MPAMYPLEMKEELETMQEGVGYLKSIGFSWDALDGLLDVPSGAVKTWILRGADGFHPLLIYGWRKPKFLLAIFLCLILGALGGMEREALERIAKDNTWEQQGEYWQTFSRDVLSLGGVSAYRGNDRNDEPTVVPDNLIRMNGLRPARIAQILTDYFPGYGVETEQDFYNICDRYAEFQATNRLKKASHG